MIQSFTSSEVSKRTGLSARQLQWWDEQGIVVPAREGHRRLYSAKDLAELAILCDLRRRGFSLQRIRKMIALLRHEFGHRLADLLSRGRGLHLLTDGESIFLRDSERGVIDLLRNTQQPLLAICIGPILQRVLANAPAAHAPAAGSGKAALPDQAPAAHAPAAGSGSAALPDQASAAHAPAAGSGSAALPDQASAAGAASVAAYPSAPSRKRSSRSPAVVQAPKKASQPVRVASAARASARP
jgi:DNA-binding transcriptional MerR regulator